MLSIPLNFKAEELGYRSLGNVADYLRTVLAGLGAADARIKSNPAQVKRVVRATLRGADFARYPAHQDKVIPFIMEDFQLDRKTRGGVLARDRKKFFQGRHRRRRSRARRYRFYSRTKQTEDSDSSRPGRGLWHLERSAGGDEKVKITKDFLDSEQTRDRG